MAEVSGKPVDLEILSHVKNKVLYIPGGWFEPINSMFYPKRWFLKCVSVYIYIYIYLFIVTNRPREFPLHDAKGKGFFILRKCTKKNIPGFEIIVS